MKQRTIALYTKKRYFLVLFYVLLVAYSQNNIAQDGRIKLPIEVLGKEKTIVTRKFILNSNEVVRNTAYLWMMVNNLSYENKGSVKINEGKWIPLNHKTVQLHRQEKARGGMTHGGFNTVRFALPATNFKLGDNKIQFRFDKSDGISIGYRVVKLNLLNEKKKKLLYPEKFIHDNPDNWERPYSNRKAINEGKDLWYNAQLWNHYLPNKRKGFWYGIKLPARRKIKARCTDCHTQDGRDLELFSYSNFSIIERSKFHGLTEEEGKKIASYIRSLTKETENVERSGRPWNPPYQPGPKVANLSIQNWQAGAGIDAVLEDDKDILPYMFPNGVNQQNVYNYFDPNKVEDRTVLPIAQQLPDWKHWLPMIHPMDAYKTRWDDESINKLPKRHYKELREYLENNDVSKLADTTELMGKLASMSWAYRGFHSWRVTQGDAYNDIKDDIGPEYSKTSRARLKAVKTFEVMHEFNMQNLSKKIYGREDNVPERQWPGRLYHVFEVAPHFTSCETTSGCKTFIGQPWTTGFYETTNWYELQLIIAGGHGISGANSPMDWKYHHNFIKGASLASGIQEPLRFFRSLNNMYQIRNWKGAVKPSKTGFQIRHQSPSWFLGQSRGIGSIEDGGKGKFLRSLDQIEPGMTQWFLNGLLNMFLTEMDKPRNHISRFTKRNAGWDGRLDEEQATPFTDERGGFNYSYHFYRLIPEFAELGADCELLSRFVDWCQAAWPSWNWKPLKKEAIAAITLKVSGPMGNPNKITAMLTNGGDNPQIKWYVNGSEIVKAQNTKVLKNNYFKPGDKISCSVVATLSCVSPKIRRKASASLVLPTTKVIVTLDEKQVSNKEKVATRRGDVLTIQKELDLKPMLWLDAMDLKRSGDYKKGDLIAAWKDKSGNKNNATQTNKKLQPKYTVTEEGIPSVWFGADDLVNRLALFSSSKDRFLNKEWTIFIAGEEINHPGSQYLFGNKTSSSDGFGFGFAYYSADRDRLEIQTTEKSWNSHKIRYPHNFLISVTKEGESILNTLNGRQGKSIPVTGDQTNSEPLYLGAFPSAYGKNKGNNMYHKGPIYEVLIFDRVLSLEEKTMVEGYLAHKWKLQNEVLEPYHKYKERSPLYAKIDTPKGEVYRDLAPEGYRKEVAPSDYGWYKVINGTSAFSFNLNGSTKVKNPNPENITVYPNPTNESFYIDGVEVEKVILYNSIGKQCGILAPEGNAYRIPTKLASGLYYMVVYSKENKHTLKIMKN